MMTFKTTSDLNMRKGAGTSYKNIQTIPKGKKVTSTGYCAVSPSGVVWYLVEFNGKLGFCSAKYLKEV